MKSEQNEYKHWKQLMNVLEITPNNLRSQNHTALLNEVSVRLIELEEKADPKESQAEYKNYKMTRKEFKNTRFGNGLKVDYKGTIAKIVSVNFEEDLFGILLKDNEQGDDFELTWIRCESCALANER